GWFLKGCRSAMGICWICSRWIFCNVAPGFCSEMVYHPLTKKAQRKLWAKLLSCFEIMLYPSGVGAVHGHGGVVEGRQQVLPDVPHLSGVLFQAHEDEPQMIAVQLHELCLHHLSGLIIPRNTNKFALAAHSVHQQLQYFAQHIFIVGAACNKRVKRKLPEKIFLIPGAVIFPFGFRSGGHVRKERISLTQ